MGKRPKKSGKNSKSNVVQGFVLKDINPITNNQKQVFDSYWSGKHLVLHGSAGTGKSYLSLYLALKDLIDGLTERVIIIRSCVESRQIGHLPGTLAEKAAVYELPYKDICQELFGRGDVYDVLKKRGQIDFQTTSFLRGLTFNNSIIIFDEIQNATWSEISTVITRIGKNTKIFAIGDMLQDDLSNRSKKEISGASDFLQIAERMKEFDLINFQESDIVRSAFIKSFLIAQRNHFYRK